MSHFIDWLLTMTVILGITVGWSVLVVNLPKTYRWTAQSERPTRKTVDKDRPPLD